MATSLRPDPDTRTRKAVFVGDLVSGARVMGFAFEPGLDAPCASDDRLLVEGDQALSVPPDRPVPSVEAPDIVRCGASPTAALAGVDGRIRPACGHLRRGLATAVNRTQLPYGGFLDTALDAVAREGHRIWHVGGAVRDLVADGPGAPIRDLDFTGTAPVGWFSETIRRALVPADGADLRQKVSENLVASLRPRGRRARILEYRPLTLLGFRFPAAGGDLEIDARTRDLTVNSLYCDPAQGELLDPTGLALPDLTAEHRRLATLQADRSDHLACAIVLVRAVKFLARWLSLGVPVDHTPLQAWAAELTPDLFGALSVSGRAVLLCKREHSLQDLPAQALIEAADLLGAAARSVIDAREPR